MRSRLIQNGTAIQRIFAQGLLAGVDSPYSFNRQDAFATVITALQTC
ncbi:MAG: hypothetical protein AB7Q37_12565 [Pyrinomonadaceae bacterium]